MPDVVLIGAGVIGLSIADELAAHGQSVLILEQGHPGKEASWAGAGMLPPGNLSSAKTPEAKLRGLSAQLWPSTSRRLREETGIDNGYLSCGSLCIGKDEDLPRLTREIRDYRSEQIEAEPLVEADIRRYESSVSPDFAHGYRLPQAAQVRNPRHLSALLASVTKRGVEIRSATPSLGFEQQGEKILAVRTPAETIPAGQFVITSGAWSTPLLQQMGTPLAVRPVRGQMVLLRILPRILNHLVEVGIRYLVPRADDRILLGATQEEVGFDKSNTLEGIESLLAFGHALVPQLRSAVIEKTWAGLRPASPDGLPLIGRLARYQNLYAATGHFRSGLQMSLGTARVMRQLLLDQPTEIDLAPYSADPDLRSQTIPQK